MEPRGRLIAGDGVGKPQKCAIVSVMNQENRVPWAPNAAHPRYLQKAGESKERTVQSWHAPEQFEIEIDITDGKEHQVALYCMSWNPATQLAVEVQDADTKAVLDNQAVKKFVDGKYLVWNVKGQVIVRVTCSNQDEGNAALASGLFIDPPAKPGK